MKKKLLTIFFSFLSISFLSAQGLICIQSGSNAPVFETDFAKAISKAKSGDYIYLPSGSSYSTAVTVKINKKLFIIGSGYHPDSTLSGITALNCPITLDSGARGSLITGIDLATYQRVLIINAANVNITRCNLDDIRIDKIYNKDSLSNVLISENIIQSLNGYDDVHPNLRITNNIIFGNIISFELSSFFYNNIVLKNSNFVIASGNYSVFENNIFYTSTKSYLNYSSAPSSQNTFNNNLFVVDSTVLTNSFAPNRSKNIFNQTQSGIFINYSGQTIWDKSLNFHLKTGCKGLGTGTYNTDMGIYGSYFSFKEGGIPINPHIIQFSTSKSTNSAGKINIKVKVQGQSL